jgi:hypothetical protein
MGERSGGVPTARAADATTAAPGAGHAAAGSGAGGSAAARLQVVARTLDTDAAAVCTILLLALLAFSPWWAAGRVIAPLDTLHEVFAPWSGGDTRVTLHNHFTSDAVTQYIGYRRFAERSFMADGRIGWNELTGAGRPDYANTMALYGDWTVQLHRLLDFWTAWHLGLLAQLLIAALGMYVLLRSERVRPLVALTGAVAFAASTPIIFPLYHRWHLASFAWVPWLLWAMTQWRRGRSAAWPLAPLFLGLALAGGSLQTSAFVVIVMVAVWAGWWWETRREPGSWRLTLHFVAWGTLGAGLAAFTLLPAVLTYLDGIGLHGARSAPGFEQGLLQPLFGLVFIPLQAVPTLLGSPASLDLAKVFGVDLAQVAFFGLVPTLVAMWCGVRGNTPMALRLLILAGLLIPLTPLVGALYHRVQLVFVLGGVWAFAHYWERTPGPPDSEWRRMAGAAGVLALCWLGVSVALLLAEAPLTRMVQGHVAARIDADAAGQLGGFREWMLARAGHIVRELRIWHPAQLVTVAAAGLGVVALRLRSTRRLEAATLVLLAAVSLELGHQAIRWHTSVDPDRYPAYPVTPDIRVLQDLAHGGRVHIAATHDGPALFFPPNTLAMYDVATIEQFETVDIHGMWQAVGRSADPEVLGRLGVTHAVAPRGADVPPGWRLVHGGASFDIWANDAAVPHYLGVADIAVVQGPAQPARSGGAHDGAAAGAVAPAVRVMRRTPNRRVLAVEPGVVAVRVAENWSEGWQYRAGGGAWRPVVRAPDRSMVLPLGEAGIVEMRYRPGRRRAGWTVTGAAALVTLLAAAGAAWRAGAVAGRGEPVPGREHAARGRGARSVE